MGMSPARRLRRSRRGEIAAFDIVLFVPLMIVALLFLSSALSVRPTLAQEATNGSRYVYSALNTLLVSTVPTTQTMDTFNHNETAQDWSVRQMMLWDVYLVSCGTTTQGTLDQPGWMGWAINMTARSVAQASPYNASAAAFSHYYVSFNGTSPAGQYCAGTPVPVHVVMGTLPPPGTVNVYTSDNVLIRPALTGEAAVWVVMGVWQQA